MTEKQIDSAIASCKERIRHLESLPKHYHGKGTRKRMIELEKVKMEALEIVKNGNVVHGKWIWHDMKDEGYTTCQGGYCECSNCHFGYVSEFDFCPRCGAKMDLEG